MKGFTLQLIKTYQQSISLVTPHSCRFTPSCSQYAYESISKFGFPKGVWMGVKRLSRCHPLHSGGYDPVP